MNGNVFGTHAVEGDQFTGKILVMTYNPAMAGASLTYNWMVEGDRFTQDGFLPLSENAENRIVEQYRRVE